MRPLHHPSLDEITVEGVLYALSDPVRARIYAQLAAADCTKTCSVFLKGQDRPLPKSTLCHHFRILREAGLIRSERRGVELHNKTRCAELKSKFGPLIESILKAYRSQSPFRSKRR
jgi:DNA-binding transcriptional ArsR family regulator